MAKVDATQALDLKVNHNLSVRQIAKLQGVSKSAIANRIKDLLPTQETEIYKKNKADILAHTQLKLITNMDDKRLKKASVNNLAYAFQNLYSCERLERGQSTSNIAIATLPGKLAELAAARKKLEEELDQQNRVTNVSNE